MTSEHLFLTVASTSKPILDACELEVRSANGLHSTIPGSPNSCGNEGDGYINSQPTHVNFDFYFTYTYTLPSSVSRPQYIGSNYKLGVVAASGRHNVFDRSGNYSAFILHIVIFYWFCLCFRNQYDDWRVHTVSEPIIQETLTDYKTCITKSMSLMWNCDWVELSCNVYTCMSWQMTRPLFLCYIWLVWKKPKWMSTENWNSLPKRNMDHIYITKHNLLCCICEL